MSFFLQFSRKFAKLSKNIRKIKIIKKNLANIKKSGKILRCTCLKENVTKDYTKYRKFRRSYGNTLDDASSFRAKA